MAVLLRVARRFMRSEEDARDAVQDAFIRLPLHRHVRLERAALDVAASHRHQRVPDALALAAAASGEGIEGYLPRFPRTGISCSPAAVVQDCGDDPERKELRHRALRHRQLADTYREVLLLRDIEELSTDEAAEAFGVTPNAVKIRLHRARQCCAPSIRT